MPGRSPEKFYIDSIDLAPCEDCPFRGGYRKDIDQRACLAERVADVRDSGVVDMEVESYKNMLGEDPKHHLLSAKPGVTTMTVIYHCRSRTQSDARKHAGEAVAFASRPKSIRIKEHDPGDYR